MGDNDPRISASLRELETSVSKFEKHYRDFAKKKRLHLVQTEVDTALNKAKTVADFKGSAYIFGTEITSVLELTKKQRASNSKWASKLGVFLTTLYPIAKLSLGLAVAAADVCTKTIQVD